MKILVMHRPDGTMFTRTPVEVADPDECARANPKGATGYAVIEHTDLPADHDHFKAARRWTGSAVTVDMTEARAIHRARLHELRAPKMAALDIDYMRADERGDAAEKARIAAEKQKLRDVTADPTIDQARTPSELKAAVPAVLR